MAYIALYRAYRPQTFVEVVDQKAIVKTLENAINNNKVAHAYLFCGPRGTGKTTLAKILAKALNCQEGPTINPCLECESCKAILNGTNPDVIEIDAASNNGADDIRALRDSVKFLPSMSRYKVYIIDEVHMLSNAAFNALLKTLEEPPKYVVFILCTTEPYKIPETILSRCQRFDFKAISNEGIFNRISEIVKEENINITDFIFTDNEMLVDVGLGKRIPVNMMGDGARKIVSLLTAVYDCKDGILLIDEISNGFHYSVMRDLWRVLIDAAMRNNTQLFVTTHDIDSIKGLRDATACRSDNSIAAFKLLRTVDDELKAFHYSLESLDYSINQEIEIR